jgi:hypothetical protein
VNRHQIAGQSGLFVFDPTNNSWRIIDYFGAAKTSTASVLDNGAWVSQARLGGRGLVAHCHTRQDPLLLPGLGPRARSCIGRFTTWRDRPRTSG